ncbi:TPA: protein deglycase YajL [Citrobacter freundii]
MSAQALVCLAPGSEETEAVTTIDLLVRGGIKVTTASVASDGNLTIVCSRGVKLLADAPLVEVADGDFDIIVLPGGIKGAECFRDSPLLVETVKQFHRSGRIVAAICAAAATVLVPHDIFPIGNMTGYPALKDKIPRGSMAGQACRVGSTRQLVNQPGTGNLNRFRFENH